MPLNVAKTKSYLKSFNFKKLFVEELGWDHATGTLSVTVDNQPWTLTAESQKRGLVTYTCPPLASGTIPPYAMRRKIERQVAKTVREHIIVYTDGQHTQQIWQWVKREPGRPDACREHPYAVTQSGEPLIQRLQNLAFTLDEEDDLTIVDVTVRTRAGLDVEKVTKKFYDRFQKEHAAFLGFITGIADLEHAKWYASVMLNRLMFVYFIQKKFIQKKGFLAGDTNYLRTKLNTIKKQQSPNNFLSFYTYFLIRLFHEGLGRKERSSELDALLGTVPYLNGGLFDVHRLERDNTAIDIPDNAFEKIFDFFDAYQWNLDDRPLKKDNEINPDVLGYIFEKYINQKQMGAYYTKEDITEYISKNTIIPYLFDAAKKECHIAFEPDSALWGLLREDPDRYIYPAVKHGVGLTLPSDIAAASPMWHSAPAGTGPPPTALPCPPRRGANTSRVASAT